MATAKITIAIIRIATRACFGINPLLVAVCIYNCGRLNHGLDNRNTVTSGVNEAQNPLWHKYFMPGQLWAGSAAKAEKSRELVET